jgi:hypothetical protein
MAKPIWQTLKMILRDGTYMERQCIINYETSDGIATFYMLDSKLISFPLEVISYWEIV